MFPRSTNSAPPGIPIRSNRYSMFPDPHHRSCRRPPGGAVGRGPDAGAPGRRPSRPHEEAALEGSTLRLVSGMPTRPPGATRICKVAHPTPGSDEGRCRTSGSARTGPRSACEGTARRVRCSAERPPAGRSRTGVARRLEGEAIEPVCAGGVPPAFLVLMVCLQPGAHFHQVVGSCR